MRKSYYLLIIILLAVVAVNFSFKWQKVKPLRFKPDELGVSANLTSEYHKRVLSKGNTFIANKTLDLLVDKITDSGALWVRETFAWELLQPGKNVWDWDCNEAVVNALLSRKLKIVGILGFTPEWAAVKDLELKPDERKDDDIASHPAKNLKDWEHYIYTTVSHYKGRVDYWEIWNEPNSRRFWKSDAALYLEYLKTAYAAAKQANPDCKILLASFNFGEKSEVEWFNEFLKMDSQAYYDILNLHLITIKAEPCFKIIRQLSPAKPLWVTEVGYNTRSEASYALQADYLLQSYKACKQHKAQKIFYYNLRDKRKAANPNDEVNWGLLTAKLNPKPAWQVFRSLTNPAPLSWGKVISLLLQ